MKTAVLVQKYYDHHLFLWTAVLQPSTSSSQIPRCHQSTCQCLSPIRGQWRTVWVGSASSYTSTRTLASAVGIATLAFSWWQVSVILSLLLVLAGVCIWNSCSLIKGRHCSWSLDNFSLPVNFCVYILISVLQLFPTQEFCFIYLFYYLLIQ